MMKMKMILLIMLLCTLSVVRAQELPVAPASPSTGGISRAGEAAVNLYTGTADISVPLYNYKSRKLSLPINVAYHGQAVKIQDIAGLVGLGWNMEIGGAITRTMRGKPDEIAYGYSSDSAVSSTGEKVIADYTSSGFNQMIEKVGTNEWDGEPDIFTCSTGGKFFFNYNKQPVFANPAGYKLLQNGLYPSAGANVPWIMVDPSGNRYYYGGVENSTETVKHTSGGTTSRPYVNVWYLSKIVSADGADSIMFSYETSANKVSYTYYQNTHVVSSYPCFTPANNDVVRHDSIRVETQNPCYLSSVKGTSLYMSLTYKDRKDVVNGKCIDQVRFYSTDAEGTYHLFSYAFKYGYFYNSTGISHLKLHTIYKVDNSGGLRDPYVSFEYNESINLPARNSIQFDHWGYFNSNNTGTSIPPTANKDADSVYVQANMLKRLIWKAGGYTDYTYEPNYYMENGVAKAAAGVRIGRITTYDPVSGQSQVVRYRYLNEDGSQSGILYSQRPQNYYSYKVFSSSTGWTNGDPNVSNPACTGYTEYTQDQTYASLFDVNGVALGYSRVTVEGIDGSKEVSYFTDINDYGNDYVENYSVSSTGLTKRANSRNFGPPYATLTSYGFMRGMIKEKRGYKYDGTLQAVVLYNYSAFIYPDTRVKGVRALLQKAYYGNLYTAARYEELSGFPQLMSSTQTIYPSGNQNQSIVTVQRFEYDAAAPFLVKRSYTSANEDTLGVQYTYVPDLAANTSIPLRSEYTDLLTRNNILLPLEEIHFVKKDNEIKYISGIVNQYQMVKIGYTKSVALLSKQLVLSLTTPVTDYKWLNNIGEIDSRYEEYFSVDQIDIQGNITRSTKRNAPGQSYSYDPIGCNIVANVINALPGEYYYEGFESYSTAEGPYSRDASHTGRVHGIGPIKLLFTPQNTRKYYLSYWYLSNGKWQYSGKQNYTPGMTLSANRVDDIRILPVDAVMNTYTYASLIGLTSVTDNNGRSIFYDYDNKQRLKSTSDNEGNITGVLDYGYNTNAVSGRPACTRVTGVITSTRIAASQWQIKWPAVSGVDHYNIEYRTEEQTTWLKTTSTTPTVVLSDLERVQDYEVRITAVCAGSTESEPSDILSFKTSQELLLLSFDLTDKSSNNHIAMTAKLIGGNGAVKTLRWGFCVVNNSIDINYQYCYGFTGANNGATNYTSTIVPAAVGTNTFESTQTTPGKSFGSIKKVVVHDILGINPWDIMRGDSQMYDFVVQ